ncbi:unnamed protein product [Cylicostephanus goldi]|uniref:Uncharacterized protein n=1 Tax=Cylicostephanus goldi TaxID=71465 RepID=A0A3P7QF17_CYLGO|nr:unnamed protein product [Cylicostephanus goldi]
MLKSSKHRDYLVQKGHMRVDKEIGVVHLVGYPVLIRNNLKTQFLEMFEDAILVSPSYFARAAILEGVNVPVQDFVRFTDGSDTFPPTFLVGNSLCSLVSLFIRSQFVEQKNTWPIKLQSSGVSYHAKNDTIDLAYGRQRLKHSILALAITDEQMDQFANDSMTRIGALLDEGLMLDISWIGDYISRRLNITADNGDFLRMVYVETNVDRVLARIFDNLVDGGDIPKSLRDAVGSSDAV